MPDSIRGACYFTVIPFTCWRTQLTLQPNSVLDALAEALKTSRDWARGRDITNTKRSARFCSDACINLNCLLDGSGASLKMRHIRVDDEYDKKKHSGEWLLDGVWFEGMRPDKRMKRKVPANIRVALECESSTSGFDYFTDFTKLRAISSDVKLFLAGLNQRKEPSARAYMNTRVQQSGELVDQYDRTCHADWYLAFWPSPLAVGGTSLWEQIDDDNKDLAHLNAISLYRFAERGFRKIGDVGLARQTAATDEMPATR